MQAICARGVASRAVWVGALLVGGALVLVFAVSPRFGDAQTRVGVAEAPDAARAELDAARAELDASREAIAAVQAQIDALPAPPRELRQELATLIETLRVAGDAERRAFERGDAKGARAAHDEAAQVLRQIGQRLRDHLAPPSNAPLDADDLAERVLLIDARVARMAAEADRVGEPFDAAAATATSAAIKQALASGAPARARELLLDYAGEVKRAEPKPAATPATPERSR